MKTKAICILGMHRSGTSTVTRAVNFLGPYLGEAKDLIPAAPDNPEGFWERADVVDLHDRILEKFRRTPDAVMPLPVNWHTAATVQPLKEELRVLIQRNFGNSGLWAWKDPRTCLTLDLWKQLLSELSIPLSCVFMVRNPLDVAKSLNKRNNMPKDKALGFWLSHNLAALDSCADLPTVFVSYDDFLNDWEAELSRVAQALQIPWADDAEELRSNMAAFVQPSLRHSQSRRDDLTEVAAPVREVYQLILDQTRKGERDGAFHATVERLLREYRTYSSFFSANLDYLFDRGKRLEEIAAKETQAAPVRIEPAAAQPAAAPTLAKRLCSLVFGK